MCIETNSCFCCNVETGSRLIAKFEMVSAVVGGFGAFAHVQTIAIVIINFIVGFMLFTGVMKRNECCLLGYLVVTVVRVVVLFILGSWLISEQSQENTDKEVKAILIVTMFAIAGNV